MSQVMRRTALRTPLAGNIVRGLARLFLRMNGWRVDGDPPPIKKYISLAAHHTSNWDFIYLLALGFASDVDIRWMGKTGMFRWPWGALMRWLGGIPVDRARGSRAAKQVITAFREHEELIVIISPEGTRGKAEGWKRGVFLIARSAGVPLVCGYLDYRRKAGGFGPVVHPSGHAEADFEPMRDFYRQVTPRHPDSMSPLRLLDR